MHPSRSLASDMLRCQWGFSVKEYLYRVLVNCNGRGGMKRTPFGLLVQELQAFHRVQDERRDPVRSALTRQIKETMSLPSLPARRTVKGSVWAVSVVKNEADIIVPVVEHLLRQGVDGILIADNGSSDDTPLLLARLASNHSLYVAQDREPGHFQGYKMDLLCDAARRAGADWLVPFDADEFWFAPVGTLADFFRSCRAHKVSASVYNLYPAEGVAFGEGQWLLERHPHTSKKCAFRSHRYARLYEGNHWVRRPGWATDGLRVLHVPWRSYDQFRRKGVQGLESLSHTYFPSGVGGHWRHLGSMSEERAREAWQSILCGREVEELCWSPRGPAERVDPKNWSVWDPGGVLAPAED
jgi:hypothetical protein